jgi:exonuclease III
LSTAAGEENPPFLMDLNPEVLNWNVQGLNDSAKRNVVREFLDTVRVNIVCLQETKLDVIDDFIVMQCLGPSFDGYIYLPVVETRGGVLLAWDTSVVSIGHVSFDTYVINGEVRSRDNSSWWITTVYGPQAREDKFSFLTELAERHSLCSGPWMAIGDFNMILFASEKNNELLDRDMMARFHIFVQELELKDIYMHGRRFT